MKDEVPHILVIDDDTRLRSLLQQYLTEQGFLVSTAMDTKDARLKLKVLKFDVLVLDIMMPGETGLQFLESVRKDSCIPVLFLSAKWETEDRILGLEKGADDYLAKPFEPKELLLRLCSILRRTQVPSAQVFSFGDCTFDRAREVLSRFGEAIPLTTMEIALLKTLLENPDVPLSREQLAEQSRISINPRTIDVQVARLRRKIEIDPKVPRYLHTVRHLGYILRPSS